MSKAIFTTSEGSAYDDQPEVRYHFPRTYLRQVEQSVGEICRCGRDDDACDRPALLIGRGFVFQYMQAGLLREASCDPEA